MPRWKTPEPQDAREHNMAYGRAYAQAARAAYQRALDSEAGATRDLGTGLIGLGGVIAALAGFKAHRDAITGAALLGGTAYAMGSWNLSKQRQLVYLAGIEGINCSVKAVAAFDMPEADRVALNNALADIEGQLLSLSIDDENVVAKQGKAVKVTGAEASLARAEEVLTESRKIAAASREVLVSGRKIAMGVYRAGGELVIAVDRIGKAVDTAILDTLPDLSSISKVVGGIAGFAGNMAPGSGVEALLTQALKDSVKKPAPEGKKANLVVDRSVTELDAAVDQLASQAQKVANATARVRGLTAAFDPAATLAGLDSCGVNVSFALTATPATVNMKGASAETYTVLLNGGTPPYKVAIQGNTPKGLSVLEPPAFDKAIRVIGSAEFTDKKTVALLVTDASNPVKSIAVEIKVAAAQTGGETTQPSGLALNTLATRIANVKEFTMDQTKVAVNPADVSVVNERIKVTVSCTPPKPAKLLAPSAILTTLLQQDVEGSKVAAGATGDVTSKIDLTGPPDCVATAAPEGRRVARKNVSTEGGGAETVQLQTKLCTKADGDWGSNSQAALNYWRGTQGKPPSSALPTADERKAILLTPDDKAAKWCQS